MTRTTRKGIEHKQQTFLHLQRCVLRIFPCNCAQLAGRGRERESGVPQPRQEGVEGGRVVQERRHDVQLPHDGQEHEERARHSRVGGPGGFRTPTALLWVTVAFFDTAH